MFIPTIVRNIRADVSQGYSSSPHLSAEMSPSLHCCAGAEKEDEYPQKASTGMNIPVEQGRWSGIFIPAQHFRGDVSAFSRNGEGKELHIGTKISS